MNNVPNRAKPDTMERTESESNGDTTSDRNNMTFLSYTVYE